MAITFGEIRKYCCVFDRVSICMLETMAYENFEFIREVPRSYDRYFLYGFGTRESKFEKKNGFVWKFCMEIMLSEKPRDFEKEDEEWSEK